MRSPVSASRKTVLMALGANLVIAVAKLIGGVVSGSASMLAEAAHSVADTTNQVFLLISLSLSKREPDEQHPFGYGTERFFWAFLAAIVIFLSGSVFSIGEGVERLISGQATEGSPIVVYVVLVAALIAEGISLARAVRHTKAQQRESGLPLIPFVRQSRDPTTKTVFTEDSVAVTGVVIALIGFTVTEVTGSPVGDAAGSIFIGLLLAGVAVALAKDTKGLLVGESARPEEREKLKKVLERREEVVDVIDLRTLALGPTELLVAARVDLADELDSSDVERVADEIDRELREAVPAVTEVFLDPTSRPGGAAAQDGSDGAAAVLRGEVSR
jgi:cation diffusion facilitator family transporter